MPLIWIGIPNITPIYTPYKYIYSIYIYKYYIPGPLYILNIFHPMYIAKILQAQKKMILAAENHRNLPRRVHKCHANLGRSERIRH